MVHHVVAIDLDRHMLDLAQAKVAAAGAENCEFIEANAYDVADWVSRPIAFVLMANTFHGVPEKERLARAVAAILRPAGFAVVNWHRGPREETTVLGQSRGPSSFRFNRRHTRHAAFRSLLGIAIAKMPTTYNMLTKPEATA